ncbi:MAG: anthranilate synthase component I [Microcystaceae cyanobacterium]
MILPWHWRSLPLNERTGSDIFEKLFINDSIATLLESPFPTPKDYPYLSRYSLCAGFPRFRQGKQQVWTPSVGTILPFLRSLLSTSVQPNEDINHLPFVGGWLGWLGYDLGWEIESLPKYHCDNLPFPVAYWYEPENFAILDHKEQLLWLAVTDPNNLDKLAKKLDLTVIFPAKNSNLSNYSLKFLSSQQQYETAVGKAKQYIEKGDIFQANLSLRFQIETGTDSWSIYRYLHQINPSPFASYWRSPFGDVVSCSPERLVQLQGNIAQTRPIAGTRPRGKTPHQDKQLVAELSRNIKENAEHIMLVDLERNDLGRVCQWGTINVDELLIIEKYSHVSHLVSNIKGILQDKYNGIDLIQALFPGGTITGCPKVRCMEIIEELEPVRRSLFYGSCGYLDIRGNLDLNILIRTLLYQSQPSGIHRVWGQVGAGIVADSDPEKEWVESLHKAEAQLTALRKDIRY